MRSPVRSLTRLSLVGAALAAAACSDQSPVAPRDNGPRLSTTSAPAAPGYIVALRGQAKSDFKKSVESLGGKLERQLNGPGLVTVSGLNAASATQLLRRSDIASVTQDVSIQWIPTTDRIVQMVAAPTTLGGATITGTDQSTAFFFDQFQWNLKVTKASSAWLTTPSGAGAEVCVLDTGTDPGHLDLDGKIDLAKSTSFVASEPFIEDFNFHGTFVSALISSNGFGMASVAPDAKLCAVKVLDFTGHGSFGDVISGIVYAADQGVDAINMSLGAYVDLNQVGAKDLVRALQAAVDYARSKGVVVVVSSGNDGRDLDADAANFLEVPAQLKGVISVGATAPTAQQNFDHLTEYSNFGGTTGIKLVAPGGDFVAAGQQEDLIFSACSEFVCGDIFHYALGAGTSFASPHVAGEAAVIESNFAGNQSNTTIEGCILKGTDVVGAVRFFGRGRMNVLKAAGC
ncbi:MAG: S8 family serine peptidase [Gemmatimonadota bacterium]